MAFSGIRSPRDSTPMGFLGGESGVSLGYIPVCEYALHIFGLMLPILTANQGMISRRASINSGQHPLKQLAYRLKPLV